MSRGYSLDLRERVVALVAEGMSKSAAGRHLRIAASSAIKWCKRREETGSLAEKPGRKLVYSPLEAHADGLLAFIERRKDATLAEMVCAISEERGVSITDSSISRFFKRRSVTFKKTLHASEQLRADVAVAREEWRKAQPALDPKKLVFVDETSTNTQMTRLRGRCKKGARLIDYVPHGHWKTTTFVAGLRHDQIVAPLVLDSPMTGVAFQAWLEQSLAPTLSPGDTVIMDNLPAHKVAGVRGLIEVTGAKLLYLPPYSPDLNPIEMMFAKLKALLRKFKERAVAALWDRIGAVLDQFTAKECSNYLEHDGYGSG